MVKVLLKPSAGWMMILVGMLMIGACAPSTTHYVQVNQFMQQEKYNDALTLMNQNQAAYDERNAALYHMELGVLAHYADRYKESNQSLARAEVIIDQLYTRSISKHAASFIINDNTIPYRGEDFEDAMLNLFMAMNYVGLRQWEDALVEARKANFRLTQYREKNPDDAALRQDAFLQYFTGLLYEADREVNDAVVSFRDATTLYRQYEGLNAPGR